MLMPARTHDFILKVSLFQSPDHFSVSLCCETNDPVSVISKHVQDIDGIHFNFELFISYLKFGLNRILLKVNRLRK